MKSRKWNISEIILCLLLATLFVFRCFILEDGEADATIEVINMAGMALALLAVLYKRISKSSSYVVQFVGLVIMLAILSTAIVVGYMHIFNRLDFSPKANDCITILALFFALPLDGICDMFCKTK